MPHLDLAAHLARVHARHADFHGPTLALDHVRRGIAAKHASIAIIAHQTRQGGDRFREEPLLADALNLALFNAIQRLFAHDDNVCPSHELQLNRVHQLACFEHALPGFEHNVFHLHGRHLPVQTQPAKGHASVSAYGATKRRKEVAPVVGPPLCIVHQVHEVLFHCGFF